MTTTVSGPTAGDGASSRPRQRSPATQDVFRILVGASAYRFSFNLRSSGIALARLVSAMLLFVPVVSVFGQTRGEVPLFKAQSDGKVIDYSIAEERAGKLPKWDPTMPTTALSIHEAVARAQAWIKKRNPKIDSFAPSRIELGMVSYGQFHGLWYYSIGFDGIVGGERMHSWGLQAVVLMDGSIVEPQPER